MKKIISMLTLTIILVFTTGVTAFADSYGIIPETRQLPRLVDSSNLLSSSEQTDLMKKLDEISERQKFDVAIVTVDSLDGKSPQDYADDFYDYNGFGQGVNKDGVLLLICLNTRDWYISTRGYGITAITDYGRERMSDSFVPELTDGNYDKAFDIYAELCDDYVTEAKSGTPYDYNHKPKGPLQPFKKIGISLLVGVVIGFISVTIMKSNLKSVHKNDKAANYVQNGSMLINQSNDIYLYRTVTRRRRESSSSGHGGSRTHTSSSGASHGGGGGKF